MVIKDGPQVIALCYSLHQWIVVETAATKSLFSGGRYHLLGFTGIQLLPGVCEFLHSLVQRMHTSGTSTQLCGRSVEVVRKANMLLTRTVCSG